MAQGADQSDLGDQKAKDALGCQKGLEVHFLEMVRDTASIRLFFPHVYSDSTRL